MQSVPQRVIILSHSSVLGSLQNQRWCCVASSPDSCVSIVKPRLPKVKISQPSTVFVNFFRGIFWYRSKGDVTLPCHDAAQCSGKTDVNCTIHGLLKGQDNWL